LINNIETKLFTLFVTKVSLLGNNHKLIKMDLRQRNECTINECF